VSIEKFTRADSTARNVIARGVSPDPIRGCTASRTAYEPGRSRTE